MRKSVAKLTPFAQGAFSLAGVENPLKLSANESPYGASPKAIQAYKDAIDKIGLYPNGTQKPLKDAIAETLNIPADNIMAGNGSEEIISILIRSYVEEGDNVVVSENGFPMTNKYIAAIGGEVIKAQEKDHNMQVDALLESVNERTKIVIVCNPNNPTGTYLPKSEIVRLEKNLRDGIILLLDNAYAEYVTCNDYSNGIDMFKTDGRIAITRTFSKGYGLAMLRIGWMLAPDAVIDAMARVRSPFNVNGAAMAAAIAAIKDTNFIADVVTKNNTVRDNFANRVRTLGIEPIPSVTNFVLLKFPDADKDGAAADDYLRTQGIICRPYPPYLRITIGTAEQMDTVFEKLSDFMQS